MTSAGIHCRITSAIRIRVTIAGTGIGVLDMIDRVIATGEMDETGDTGMTTGTRDGAVLRECRDGILAMERDEANRLRNRLHAGWLSRNPNA